MLKSVYTNTSKPTAVAGLLILTVGLAYAQSHSTEIVEGTLGLAKQGIGKVEELMHKGKKQYSVCEQTYDGRIRDTGKRIWR
jgi:hypothetical protein